MRLCIMQGRLVPPENARIQSFPRQQWADEFELARQAGVKGIEWIFDEFGRDVNPLSSEEGIARLRSGASTSGISVDSLVADYFMDFPFVGAQGTTQRDRRETLAWLMRACASAGISRITLPFVDASSIRTTDDEVTVRSVLRDALVLAETLGIELHLETDLAPAPFARLVDAVAHERLRINYDSGNSASLGYDIEEEFAAYGAHIGSVHIKDRVRGGSTVPLGTGSVDFEALFDGLSKLNYGGDLVLQVARGRSGDEVEWARANAEFVRGLAGTAVVA